MRLAVAAFAIACLGVRGAVAQRFLDPGFEQTAVDPGNFLKPTTGPWGLTADAKIVRPFGQSSTWFPDEIWSATRDAYEGEQYASTYAGADGVIQRLTFDRPGAYEVSVAAFAPAGEVQVPGIPGLIMPLVDGEFLFRLGSIEPTERHVVPAGSSWTRYASTFNVTEPGSYLVGTLNSRGAVYFINYDDFRIRPVPEPSAGALALGAFGCTACRRRRRRVEVQPYR